MKVFVKAKPGARESKIEKIDEAHFNISVKEPPINGRANAAIIKLISEFFNIPQANVRLLSGFASKNKIFEIY